jgi:hypothetical protein
MVVVVVVVVVGIVIRAFVVAGSVVAVLEAVVENDIILTSHVGLGYYCCTRPLVQVASWCIRAVVSAKLRSVYITNLITRFIQSRFIQSSKVTPKKLTRRAKLFIS